MTQINAFDAFVIFSAIRLHFDDDSSYDWGKYKGKLNYSQSSFEVNQDKYFYAKLASKYSKEDFTDLVIAQCLDKDSNITVQHLLADDAKKLMIAYQKKVQSLSYLFEEELKKILEQDNIPVLIRVPDSHTNPPLLSLYLQNEISLETLMILDNIVFHFTEKWNDKLEDTIVWPEVYKKIGKYKPFLSIDTNRCKKILLKCINSSTKTKGK